MSLSWEKALSYFPQKLGKRLLDAFYDSVKKKEAFNMELPFTTAKNNQIWIRIIGKPVNNGPKVYKMSGTLQDITQEKQTALELEKAKRKAEEAARAQEVFLSTMSHEIRTPMNAVIGITHLLLNDNPPDYQLPPLRTLKFSAENLMVLINDILDFNKLESGQFMFEEIPFNLREMAESLKDSLSHKAHEKGISIKLKMDTDIPELLIGDKTRITQVLNNLVNNAIKFTEKGGVVIDIEVKENQLDELAIYFSVKDSGIGISPSKQKYIFKRFTQADPEISRKYGGTGLGLAISKKIVELLGGSIRVKSAPNKGSVFAFTLTFQKVENNQEELQLEDTLEKDLKGAKILLVEDNKINQLVVRQFLEKWNAQLEIADNGQEGLELIRDKKHYDLVLMDLEMPLLNGYQATKKVREIDEPYFQQLPILALTASALQNVRNKVRAVGMNDYISKPFHPSEFYQKITFYLKTPEEQEDLKAQIVELPHLNRESLLGIINGSEEFFDQFVEMTEAALIEFTRAYEICLPEFNLQALRENAHKIKATLKLIGADALMAEIARGKQLAQQKSTPVLLTDQSVMRVKALAQQIVVELKKQKRELLQKSKPKAEA